MAKKENEIIEAAIALVAEKGVMAFTSKEVVEKVGCSPSLMYKYFDSNEDLLKRCCQRISDRYLEIADGLMRDIQPSGDWRQTNIMFFSEYIRRNTENPTDHLFYHAMSGTIYDWMIKGIDNLSVDPFFKRLKEFVNTKDEQRLVDLKIKYSCTKMALEDFVRAIVLGQIPNTEEVRTRLAVLLCDGVGPFVFG